MILPGLSWAFTMSLKGKLRKYRERDVSERENQADIDKGTQEPQTQTQHPFE
jgi:hypothetical protein